MKAPEKIQIHLIKNDYDAWSVRGYSFLADKQMGMTEYTRTDAFIEKACEWLKEIFFEYENLTDYNPMDDFKNYMKGERDGDKER